MIDNPNSSGQGRDPDYLTHPWRFLVEAFGFTYSHSTPIGGAAPYVSHTFERGERRVSLDRQGGLIRWQSTTSTASAQGRHGHSMQSLARHLVRISPVNARD